MLVINTLEISIHLRLRTIPRNVHEGFVRQSITPLIIRHDIAILLRHQAVVIRGEIGFHPAGQAHKSPSCTLKDSAVCSPMLLQYVDPSMIPGGFQKSVSTLCFKRMTVGSPLKKGSARCMLRFLSSGFERLRSAVLKAGSKYFVDLTRLEVKGRIPCQAFLYVLHFVKD